MHRPVLVTPPDIPPVSITEAKEHLRVDGTDDDALIERYINAATTYLDGWTGILGRCIAEQEWRQDFDGFAHCLPLPLGPVIAISSVRWRNAAGVDSAVPPADYSLICDAGGRCAVRFSDGFSFPSGLDQSAAVSVTFTAGYQTVDSVSTAPQSLKHAILLLIGHWYENREGVVTGATGSSLPLAFDALIAPHRWIRL